MANIVFKRGTKAQYDALTVKNPNALYWLYDVRELRKGAELYGAGSEATPESSGLMSAADKEKLDSISGEAEPLNLYPADSAVFIVEDEGTNIIGVGVSGRSGNALSIEDDGLYVSGQESSGGAEFSIVQAAPSGPGVVAVYRLTRTDKKGVTYAGSGIEIPAYYINSDNANGLTVSGTEIGLSLATQQKAGAMSAQDKKKLDHLSSGGSSGDWSNTIFGDCELIAADWKGNQQVVYIDEVAPEATVVLSVSGEATLEQIQALAYGCITASVPEKGVLEFTALGDIPTIDIPVTLAIIM